MRRGLYCDMERSLCQRTAGHRPTRGSCPPTGNARALKTCNYHRGRCESIDAPSPARRTPSVRAVPTASSDAAPRAATAPSTARFRLVLARANNKCRAVPPADATAGLSDPSAYAVRFGRLAPADTVQTRPRPRDHGPPDEAARRRQPGRESGYRPRSTTPKQDVQCAEAVTVDCARTTDSNASRPAPG